MKKLILVTMISAGLVCGAYAQTATKHDDNMTYNVKGVLLKLQDSGYQNICNIEMEKGFYKVKAFNAKGNTIKFKIPSNGGNLSETIQASQNQGISMFEAVDRLETAGYSRISKIEAEGKCYEADALDSKGHAVNLCVDRWTGRIKKDYLEIF